MNLPYIPPKDPKPDGDGDETIEYAVEEPPDLGPLDTEDPPYFTRAEVVEMLDRERQKREALHDHIQDCAPGPEVGDGEMEARHWVVVTLGITLALLIAFWILIRNIEEMNENNNKRKIARVEACRGVNPDFRITCLEAAE